MKKDVFGFVNWNRTGGLGSTIICCVFHQSSAFSNLRTKMAQKDAQDSYSGRFGNYFNDQAYARGGQVPMHAEDRAYAVLQRQFADFSLSDHNRRPSRNLRRPSFISDLLKYSSVAEILPFISLDLRYIAPSLYGC